MKHIVILGDGMAGNPIASLGHKTTLMAANKPNIDALAAQGRSGMLKTVPDAFHPGSEIANLSVLGYHVADVFEGRGSLEAAAMGIPLQPGDLALRCNLICLDGENIKNHSAGHISDVEAAELVQFLNKEICPPNVIIYPGVSYRHLMVIKGGNKAVTCFPPHDYPNKPWQSVLPVAETAEGTETAQLILNLILASQKALANHPVNVARAAAGKDVANTIWPWSPGYKPKMQTLSERYGIGSSVVISAVDLIRGIGVYAGMKVVMVEGATGLYNTNYEGKAAAAIEALRHHDFVYLHIEASDEAGHEGDAELKIRTIEYLDQRIVKPIMDEITTWSEPVAVAILPDHPTPCELRTHTRDHVPFSIWYPGIEPDAVQQYNEVAAREGGYGFIEGQAFMNTFIAIK